MYYACFCSLNIYRIVCELFYNDRLHGHEKDNVNLYDGPADGDRQQLLHCAAHRAKTIIAGAG